MLWTEAAFSACLAWHWPDYNWQCNWRVAWTSSCMCAGKRRTLRATIVTIFSHSTRDVPFFVKCDTIFTLFFFGNYHKLKHLTFTWLFGQPCRNAWADLNGSIPECAQVCALHIEPHLATLRKTEMVAVICTNETIPIFWVFNSPSPAPRGRWTPKGERARRQTLSLYK